MSAYEAILRLEGETETPVHVEVDLTDEAMVMKAGEIEVASWPRKDMRISALPDGFHIRAEGEVVVLNVEDDAKFALELGLKNAHPNLRRRMSALMRDE